MGNATRLLLTSEQRAALVAHARAATPEECCGVLVGEWDSDAFRVVSVLPASNVAGDRERRYSIDPRDLLDAHKQARARGLEVVGYYHSHPRDPAVPSARDRDDALAEASYVIVSLAGSLGGAVPDLRSWRLTTTSGSFLEETITLVDDGRTSLQELEDHGHQSSA